MLARWIDTEQFFRDPHGRVTVTRVQVILLIGADQQPTVLVKPWWEWFVAAGVLPSSN